MFSGKFCICVFHCLVLQTNLQQVHNKYMFKTLICKDNKLIYFLCTENGVCFKGKGFLRRVFIFFSTTAAKIHPAHVISVIYPVGGINDGSVWQNSIPSSRRSCYKAKYQSINQSIKVILIKHYLDLLQTT